MTAIGYIERFRGSFRTDRCLPLAPLAVGCLVGTLYVPVVHALICRKSYSRCQEQTAQAACSLAYGLLPACRPHFGAAARPVIGENFEPQLIGLRMLKFLAGLVKDDSNSIVAGSWEYNYCYISNYAIYLVADSKEPDSLRVVLRAEPRRVNFGAVH